MTGNKDKCRHEESYDGDVGAHTHGQAVEHAGQDTSRETKGEETHVREHVAKQSGNHVVGIPEAETNVEEDVLARTVVEHDHASCHNHQHHEPGSTHRAGEHAQGNTHEEQYPTDSAHGILEAKLDGEVNGLEHHTEEYLHATDDEREVEHGLIVLIEHVLHLLEEGKVDVVQAETEGGTRERTCQHGGQAEEEHQRALEVGVDELEELGEHGQCQHDQGSVSHISEAEAEEEHEEGSEEHGEVELAILGEHIQLGQRLEESEELVVAQLDGDIVLLCGVVNLIVMTGLVEVLAHGVERLLGCPALEQHELIIGHAICTESYLREVDIGLHSLVSSLEVCKVCISKGGNLLVEVTGLSL